MQRRAGFGGGCHWCTEAVFKSLQGIGEVKQGFISSDAPHDTFSEAVDVTWDDDQIGFDDLIAVHLATHASTSRHKMRGKYRSAVYVHSDDDAAEARRILDRIATETDSVFVTEVMAHRDFKPSDQRFQDYYTKNREGPFCESYIEPKLALLRQRFAKLQTGA